MILGTLPILILMISILLPKNEESKKASKTFMIFCCVVVTLFIGLRSRYMGSIDTSNYAGMFERLRGVSFSEGVLSHGKTISDFIFEEGGFLLYMWSLAQIFSSAQPFIFVSTTISTILVGRFIYKHSEDEVISWIVYICLGLMTFNMNGMRQSLAMAICLLSYDFAKEKKLFRFLLIVFLAFLFHKTAFVFLMVYPLCNYNPNSLKNTCLVALTGLFLTFSRQLAAIYDEWAGKDYASGESFEGGGGVVVITYVLLILLSVLYIGFEKKEDGDVVRNLSILIGVGFVFYFSRYISTQIFERVSYYFFYFSLLLFPKLKNLFNRDSRYLYKLIVIGLAIILFCYRASKGAFADFGFFWQEVL